MIKNSFAWRIGWAIFCLILSMTAPASSEYAAARRTLAVVAQPLPMTRLHWVLNDIPTRIQWDGNYGYCGEVSMISAGLYYGQYLSQYDVRAIASPAIKQYKQHAQLLLGVNAVSAAQRLRLAAKAVASKRPEVFYAWLKDQVVKGYPVIMGVFTNAGDAEYDHIVPVFGVGSDFPLNTAYHPTDVIQFSDNSAQSPYYAFEIKAYLANRQVANAQDDNTYSLPTYPTTKYGLAITGVLDKYHETLPVRLTTNVNYERPAIVHNTASRPKAMPITLTITVSNLHAGEHYNLYYYHNQNDVPSEFFNKTSANAGILPWKTLSASGNTWTTSLTIKSSDKAFFRAVRVNGP
jgi:hypothetical protein